MKRSFHVIAQTLEEATSLLQAAEDAGYRWPDLGRPTESHKWFARKAETVYTFGISQKVITVSDLRTSRSYGDDVMCHELGMEEFRKMISGSAHIAGVILGVPRRNIDKAVRYLRDYGLNLFVLPDAGGDTVQVHVTSPYMALDLRTVERIICNI